MIGQYLPQTNESATVPEIQNFCYSSLNSDCFIYTLGVIFFFELYSLHTYKETCLGQ